MYLAWQSTVISYFNCAQPFWTHHWIHRVVGKHHPGCKQSSSTSRQDGGKNHRLWPPLHGNAVDTVLLGESTEHPQGQTPPSPLSAQVKELRIQSETPQSREHLQNTHNSFSPATFIRVANDIKAGRRCYIPHLIHTTATSQHWQTLKTILCIYYLSPHLHERLYPCHTESLVQYLIIEIILSSVQYFRVYLVLLVSVYFESEYFSSFVCVRCG